ARRRRADLPPRAAPGSWRRRGGGAPASRRAHRPAPPLGAPPLLRQRRPAHDPAGLRRLYGDAEYPRPRLSRPVRHGPARRLHAGTGQGVPGRRRDAAHGVKARSVLFPAYGEKVADGTDRGARRLFGARAAPAGLPAPLGGVGKATPPPLPRTPRSWRRPPRR